MTQVQVVICVGTRVDSKSVLQCVAVCRSVLQSVAEYSVCYGVFAVRVGDLKFVQRVCCNTLQCAARLHRAAVFCNVLQCVSACLQCCLCRNGSSCRECAAIRCSVLQCVEVCCRVLQCVAVCCSVVPRVCSVICVEMGVRAKSVLQ